MKNFAFIIITLLLLASVGGNVYLYDQHKKDQALIKNPDIIYQNEEAKIISDISKLIELPNGEQPTIATVLEKEKLADQPFFTKAENGDKIIVFAQSRKALIYRQSTNKIIEFAQIELGTDNVPNTKTTPTATPKPTDNTEE